MTLSGKERIANYRARQKELGEEDSSRWNKKFHKADYEAKHRKRDLPFCGCDGEGAGKDDKGRQKYVLFRMGDRELYNNGESLSTLEILDFIFEHPQDEYLMGFYFDYDVCLILKDLPNDRKARLFKKQVKAGPGFSPYTWYKNFNIQYLKKQFFKVQRVTIQLDEAGKEKRIADGPPRVIYESFGNFQKSFLKMIEAWNIGTPEERELVRISKLKRGAEEWKIADEERHYCYLECRMLAELMERFRQNTYASGIKPRTWNGAGKLAKALHAKHGSIKHKDLELYVPKRVQDYAAQAYVGGRFEVPMVGEIRGLNGKVYENDIHSAYPAVMRRLPCLRHAVWKKAKAPALLRANGLFVARCKFQASSKAKREGGIRLGGLPVRTDKGVIVWPEIGEGVYWSPEIHSAEKLGHKITYIDGYIYSNNCAEHDCDGKVYEWMADLYSQRQLLGDVEGHPLKLGINACYGTHAQRVGTPEYGNVVYASLITSLTRTMINEAIALAPDKIAMIATDGIYSLIPLKLDLGDGLGQWDYKELDGIFIVQPGLYWELSQDKKKAKQKSRGVSAQIFTADVRARFEKEWKDFHARENSKLETVFPTAKVYFQNFIGLKAAKGRGDFDLAGKWEDKELEISFDYRNKRSSHKWKDNYIVTKSKKGSSLKPSLPHKDYVAQFKDYDEEEPFSRIKTMLEDNPDFVELTPPKD